MKLVDVHAHFTYKNFKKDIDKVIKNMKSAGVSKVISNGLSFEDNKNVLKLSKKYDIVDAALGLYPTEAGTISNKDLDKILNQIEENKTKIVAIGEVGLDYYWTKEDAKKQRQKEVLSKIIKLANKINKPLIVHSRNAELDTVEIMKSAKVPVIMHCFCGNLEATEKANKYGYYFSIPVTIVRSKTFKKLVKRVGISRLLTETDAPFLAPKPGERNDSSNIGLTIQKISEVSDIDEKSISNKILSNYNKLFI
jgi:TatD DNase family protein